MKEPTIDLSTACWGIHFACYILKVKYGIQIHGQKPDIVFGKSGVD